MTVSYYLLILIYRKPFLIHFDCCHRVESFCKPTFANITLATSLLTGQPDNITSDHGWVKWSIKCMLRGRMSWAVCMFVYIVSMGLRDHKWQLGDQWDSSDGSGIPVSIGDTFFDIEWHFDIVPKSCCEHLSIARTPVDGGHVPGVCWKSGVVSAAKTVLLLISAINCRRVNV